MHIVDMDGPNVAGHTRSNFEDVRLRDHKTCSNALTSMDMYARLGLDGLQLTIALPELHVGY